MLPTSTGVSERGGRIVSTSHHAEQARAQPTVSAKEQYELADYSHIEARRELEEKEARRAANRAQKRRWLEDQDEMKFSHSIQFNAVPDWSSHYIAYSNLKKLYAVSTPFLLASSAFQGFHMGCADHTMTTS